MGKKRKAGLGEAELDLTSPYISTLWFDPGGTTGWCVISIEAAALLGGGKVLDNIYHWSQGQMPGDEMVQADALSELVSVWPGAAVGIESFELRKFTKDKALLAPVRLGAMIEWAVTRGGGAGVESEGRLWSMHWQTPSAAMSTCSDSALRSWGMYRADGEEHARDATRHALLFLRRVTAGVSGSLAGEKRAAQLRHTAWPHRFDTAGALVELEDAEEVEASP